MSVSAAPGWALTSVQWLQSKYHAAVSTGSKTPAPERLVKALRRLSYMQAEQEAACAFAGSKYTAKVYQAMLETLVDGWTEQQHKDMVAFILDGGYEARSKEMKKKVLEQQLAALAAADLKAVQDKNGMLYDPVFVAGPDGVEALELEMPPEDQAAQAAPAEPEPEPAFAGGHPNAGDW